ncbi:MAG: DUF4198 domain-containing protein [Pseudomonadota bacterium]|nr:DUF4198 domain-containing protein [Pseudomonadota bacterium]
MKKYTSILAIGLLAVSSAALAHTAWLEAVPGKAGTYRVFFGGHAGKLETMDPAKAKTIDAMDAKGRKLQVSRTIDSDGILVKVSGKPALITMHYDNGIHTRTATGPSISKPMNEVPGAVSATNAVKYHKAVVSWVPMVTRAVGQPFEVVPMDATQPLAGKPMRILVRMDGKPAAGIKLGRGEDNAEAVTDANGVTTFTPQAGLNKVWAGKRIETTTEPRYTQLSYEYLLVFNAR